MSDIVHLLLMASGASAPPPWELSGRDVLSLDGVDDHVLIADVPALAVETIAVDFWLPSDFPEGLPARDLFSSGAYGTHVAVFRAAASATAEIFSYNYSNAAFVETYNSYTDDPGGIPVTLAEWHRYVLTRADAGAYNEYLDGVLARTGTVTGTSYQDSVYGAIGAYSNSTTTADVLAFFKGLVANVRQYNRVLSSGEIATIDSVTSGLIRHYVLDEGTGTTADDDGSDAAAGTLIGGTWVSV